MSLLRKWTRPNEARSLTVTPDNGAPQQPAVAAIVPQGDRFLALLSHELRTPLTPILAIVTALEKAADVPPSVRAMLERIRRNVELESRLIDDLLDMTRIERQSMDLRLEMLELDALLLDVIRSHQKQIRNACLELQVALTASPSFVMADPARLRQIVSNLLSNALKFTPPGGTVQVATSNPRAGIVSVTVEDNGAGIEPSLIDTLFAPFVQVQGPGERSGGLGLGLSIAKGLVEAHGGRMWARSDGLSRGSIFGFELPVVERPVRRVPKRDGVRGVRPLTILLVEDHPDSAQTIADLLELDGHRTLVAPNMKSALDLAKQPFDVLISDIGLPDGTGIDLIQKLSEHGPVHAIALSGFSSSIDVERSMRAGFSEHLTKPVGMERLLEVVERVGGRRRAEQPPQAREERVQNEGAPEEVGSVLGEGSK